MSLKFETNDILGTLLDIAIGGRDYEIYKHTRHKIKHFPDLKQAGAVIITFARNQYLRDAKGRFVRRKNGKK